MNIFMERNMKSSRICMIPAQRNSVIRNMDYPVFSENAPTQTDFCVFNTEYRVLQKMKRMNSESHVGGQHDCQYIMRELLAAANGAIAYDFPWEILLSHAKEYGSIPESSALIPMTMIAWKTVSGRMFCSVERIFLEMDNLLPLEDNLLSNVYMEQAAQTVSKLSQEQYYPLGIIGKGDYIRTLRKVFVDQFGYILI
jgi:hypothetical protein